MDKIVEALYNLFEAWEYTNFIDENTPKEIIDFLREEFPNFNTVKRAVEVYKEDKNKFPSNNSIDSLDIIYDEDHKRFYRKYKAFADKCKQLSETKGISGYNGLKDYERLKIAEMCRFVDYTFPYGWK